MTAIVKSIYHLGRIVLPQVYRRKLGIFSTGKVRIYESGGVVMIEPATPFCKLCGATEDICSTVCLCSHCIDEIKRI